MQIKALLNSLLAATAVTSASAAQLQQIQSFGENPTRIQMHLYVPDKVAANPVVIVGVGDGQKRKKRCSGPEF
jgi:acetylxylan esterase